MKEQSVSLLRRIINFFQKKDVTVVKSTKTTVISPPKESNSVTIAGVKNMGSHRKYKLSEKQKIFAVYVAELIKTANRMGYAVTLGESYRPTVTAQYYAKVGKGIKNSLHTKRLAIDLNLFKGGKYLTKTSEYTELGEWWEKRKENGIKFCWGGRFKSGDANHFSIEHNGVK